MNLIREASTHILNNLTPSDKATIGQYLQPGMLGSVMLHLNTSIVVESHWDALELPEGTCSMDVVRDMIELFHNEDELAKVLES